MSTIDTAADTLQAYPLDARRNFVAFCMDLTTAMAGLSFVPATIVLVGLASRFTENKA